MKLKRFSEKLIHGDLLIGEDEEARGFPVVITSFAQSTDTVEVKFPADSENLLIGLDGSNARLIFGDQNIMVSVFSSESFPIIKLKKIHSRDFIRVDTLLPVIINKISPEDIHLVKDQYLTPHWTFGSTSIVNDLLNNNMKKYNDIEAAFPKLFNILADIDIKLNLILSMFSADEMKELIFSKPREINISGSGMAFWTDQRYEPGDYVGVRMILPISPMALISFIARVVAFNHSDNKRNDKDFYRVSVKFHEIAEYSKEKLIKYVFQRQREKIRQKPD